MLWVLRFRNENRAKLARFQGNNGPNVGFASENRLAQACSASHFSASRAAMQPMPADVTA